jgi:flagellar hook-associated protein 3 FlgL
MLDRVGTSNHSTVLLGEYQRIQSRIVTAQTQISSGKVGDQYTDIDGRSGVLAAAKAKAVRTDALSTTAKEVQSRLSMQDVQLQHLAELSDSLREAVGNAVATGRAEALKETAESVYKTAASILNTQVDGVYIYGGTRSDVPPVSETTLSGLLALPAVGDVFQNSGLTQTQSVEEGVSLETGQLASDLATDLFQMLRDLAAFDAGVNGPFTSTLTGAQTTFLEGQLQALPAVSRGLNDAAAINGARYAQIEDVVARHEDTGIELKKFIGDLEDVDLAEAITRLNQDQAAQQAAARMISQLQDNSLLRYLS